MVSTRMKLLVTLMVLENVDLDGDGSADITAASYRVETGGFTPSGATEPENTYEFYYDDSYNMLGGKESFGAETIIYLWS